MEHFIQLFGQKAVAPSTWLLSALFLPPFVGIAWHGVQQRRQRRRKTLRLHAYGRQRGLLPSERRMLLRLSRAQGVNDPLNALRLPYVFDRIATGAGRRSARRLNAVRQRLDFERHGENRWLRTTRQLEPGLELTVEIGDVGGRWSLLSADTGLLCVPVEQNSKDLLST